MSYAQCWQSTWCRFVGVSCLCYKAAESHARKTTWFPASCFYKKGLFWRGRWRFLQNDLTQRWRDDLDEGHNTKIINKAVIIKAAALRYFINNRIRNTFALTRWKRISRMSLFKSAVNKNHKSKSIHSFCTRKWRIWSSFCLIVLSPCDDIITLRTVWGKTWHHHTVEEQRSWLIESVGH